jgi:hypothetical protein
MLKKHRPVPIKTTGYSSAHCEISESNMVCSRSAGPDHLCTGLCEPGPDRSQVSGVICGWDRIGSSWPRSLEVVQPKVEVDHVPGQSVWMRGVAPDPVVQAVKAVFGVAGLLVASCRGAVCPPLCCTLTMLCPVSSRKTYEP